MKYQELINVWLENYVQPTAKSRTYEHYKYLTENHIVPKLGSMEMNEITLIEMQRLVSDLLREGNKSTGKGLAPSTVNTVITVLQSSFRIAQNIGEIADNIAYKIKRPKKDETRVECFSNLEQKRIEQFVMEYGKPKMFGILICLYTGIRIGELLALEWSDVDFEKGLLFVNKSSRDNKSGKGGKRIVDSPKTKTSRRVIPIPKQLIPLLKKHRHKTNAIWIVSDKGRPVSTRSYQRSFELLLKNAGVERRGFHSLRHTFATRAIECGVDVKTLSEILGHKNATVTLNLYVHSLLEHKKEMMNRIGNAL